MTAAKHSHLGPHLLDDPQGQLRHVHRITSDSDLSEPIRLSVSEGVPVGIVNPHRRAPTNPRPRDVASFEVPLHVKTAAFRQMPPLNLAANGKEIHKPNEW